MRPTYNSLHCLLYLLGLSAAEGETTEAERVLLRRLAAGRRRVVEIGVFHGCGSRLLREAMAPDGILTAIDPYPRHFLGLRGYGWARIIAHREVAKCANGQVQWIETMGKDGPREPRVQACLPVDFVFFDGDHSWDGLREDWEAWRPHIAPGGIVCFHDSRAQHATFGCARFTAEVICKDPEFELLDPADTITALRRRMG